MQPYLDPTPFSLGMPGERWNTKQTWLYVPIPGSDDHVLVQRADWRQGEVYIVAVPGRVTETTCLLSTVAMVYQLIEEYTNENLQD